MKHVYSHRDGNALCDIADEVERLFGFGCCVVTLGPICGLYIDTCARPDQAYEYARELVAAAKDGTYQQAIRR